MTDTEILDYLQEAMAARPPFGGMRHDLHIGSVVITVPANGFGADLRHLAVQAIEHDRVRLAQRVANALGSKH